MTETYDCSLENAAELHEHASAACARAQWAEAEQAALQALAAFENQEGVLNPDVANISNLLSEIAEAQGRCLEASTYARRAWEIMEHLGDRCQGPEADEIRADALIQLGTALHTAGRYREAETWLQLALEHAERTKCNLAAALNALGVLSKYTGKFTRAEQFYGRALALVAEDSAAAATLHHNLGGLALVRGEFAKAEGPARRAWEIRRDLLGENHPETLADACAYAAVLDGLGRHSEAEAIYLESLARFSDHFGGEHLQIALNLNNLAAARWAQGDASTAESLYRRAAVMKGKLLGVGHPDTALTLHNYASMLVELGRTGEARELETRALAVFESALDPFHPWRVAANELWQKLEKTTGGKQ